MLLVVGALLLTHLLTYSYRDAPASLAAAARWVLSSLIMLEHEAWVDGGSLRRFILSCQDTVGGGISDKPGDEADIFHTFFGIAGLSLLRTDGVPPIDAAHALPTAVMARLKNRTSG